jgi:hypothetical protein
MGYIKADLSFLADLPKYETEKPYSILASINAPKPDDFPEGGSNVDFDKLTVPIHDLRGSEDDFTIVKNGFQVVPHVSKAEWARSWEGIASYKRETEAILTRMYNAEFVLCWDYRVYLPFDFA